MMLLSKWTSPLRNMWELNVPFPDWCWTFCFTFDLQALSNFLSSPLLSPASEERTVKDIQLNAEADWGSAWEKNLHRQTLYNNIVKEVFNSFTRILGWHLISTVNSEIQRGIWYTTCSQPEFPNDFQTILISFWHSKIYFILQHSW